MRIIIRLLILVVLLARAGEAQLPAAMQTARGSDVSGTVRDSIADGPLAGAVVQLVATAAVTPYVRTTVSDSLGRYRIEDVPEGRYTLGFLHAMLESLGVEPPMREIVVDGRSVVRADLATPSLVRFRGAVCPRTSALDSSTVIVGSVRDAHSRAPLAEATVTAEWAEYSFTTGEISRQVARRTATTAESGWFALCDVPRAGTVALAANHHGASTDTIGIDVPAGGFVRRELYIGSATDGRLSGTVVAALGGRPLADAQVGIADGPQTRANERGEWSLSGIAGGTRLLDVRAIGYYPARQPVDVVTNAPPVRVELSDMKAVLDTVRVVASRMSDRHNSGFEDRRRSGIGRYMTADEISQRQPIVVSDLFMVMPGIRMDRGSDGLPRVLMRAPFGGLCSPAVYVDGSYMFALSAHDLDNWVGPDEIMGIEVYTGVGVPMQFSTGMGGLGTADAPESCGSIVVWTKPRLKPASRISGKRHAMNIVGVMGLVFAIRALIDRR